MMNVRLRTGNENGMEWRLCAVCLVELLCVVCSECWMVRKKQTVGGSGGSGGWWYNVHVFSNMTLMLSANSLSLASSAAEMRARYVASLPLSFFHTSRHSCFCSP